MPQLCESCNGTGKIYYTNWTFDGDSDRQYPMEEIEEVCDDCGGTGQEFQDE